MTHCVHEPSHTNRCRLISVPGQALSFNLTWISILISLGAILLTEPLGAGPQHDTTTAAPAAPPGRALVLDVLKHGHPYMNVNWQICGCYTLTMPLDAGPEQDTTAAAPAAPPGRALVLDVLKHGRSAGHLRLSLSLPNQRCIFGRIPTCDVVLEHGSISRQHAQLATDAACHVFLSDLGSGLVLIPVVQPGFLHGLEACARGMLSLMGQRQASNSL